MAEADAEQRPRPKGKTSPKLKRGTKPIAAYIAPPDAAKAAIEAFKAQPRDFAIAGLAVSGVTFLGSILAGKLGALGGIVSIAAMIASIFFAANAMQMALDAVDGKPVSVDALKAPHPRLKDFVIVSIVVGLAVAIGMMLVVIPGVIAFALLMSAPLLVLDKGLAPGDALKRSVAMGKAHLKDAAVMAVIAIVMGVLGAIPLGAGSAAGMLAVARYYRGLGS